MAALEATHDDLPPVPRPGRDAVSEPRLRMAIAHADDDTNTFLDRLYGGEEHRGPRNSMKVPWTRQETRVNPVDVLATFLYAAHMGHERHLKAVQADNDA